MGRVLLGLAIGVAMVVALGWIVRCLPEPGGGIEWVHRPEAVVVQMKTVGGTVPDAFKLASVPEFTLYGDGTLVFTDPSKDGTDAQVLRGTLSNADVRDLLGWINDIGFMNFAYAQPMIDVPGFATTYIYVSTRKAANAVSGYAISVAQPTGSNDTSGEYHDLQRVRARLKEIMQSLIDAGATAPYPLDPLTVFVGVNPPGTQDPADWPVSLVNIAGSSSLGEQKLDGEVALALTRKLGNTRGTFFLWGNSTFSVAYRPVLPYEENFPEFEPPP